MRVVDFLFDDKQRKKYFVNRQDLRDEITMKVNTVNSKLGLTRKVVDCKYLC